VSGQRAQVFGWIESPGRAPEPVLQPLTEPGEPVVAILLTEIPGRTTDALIVDGNGDPANPTFDGTVLRLLCSQKGCG